MSREVIGDAPVVAEVVPEPRVEGRIAEALRTSRQAFRPPAPTRVPEQERASRLPALAAAAAVLAVACGAVGYAVADPPGEVAPGVAVALSGTSGAFSQAAERRVLLSITIANPGDEAVRVAGYAPTTRSSAATAIDRPSAYVAPGDSVEITVDIALRCGSASPLRIPDLVVEARDGGQRPVPVAGAAAALIDLCAEGPQKGQPLAIAGIHREGQELVVVLTSPSNRRGEITGVRAAGVPLDATPLPLQVDRNPAELRLRPPASCPPAWVADGIPTRLDVELVADAPAIVRLSLGTPLAEWALDVACRSS